MQLTDLGLLDGRLVIPKGTGSISGNGVYRCGAGWGGLTVEDPFLYVGGGTQDVVKLSAQGAGNGGVILANDATLSDYRPMEIRGKTVTLKYRIPDSSDPNGFSNMSLPGLKLDTTGHVVIYNAVDFSVSDVSYVKLNENHGLRFNNAADTATRFTMEDDGRLRIHGLAGSGKRALHVDSQGYLCV